MGSSDRVCNVCLESLVAELHTDLISLVEILDALLGDLSIYLRHVFINCTEFSADFFFFGVELFVFRELVGFFQVFLAFFKFVKVVVKVSDVDKGL